MHNGHVYYCIGGYTMVKVRTRKAKGSALEYDVQYSLTPIYPDIYRTSERGYQRQFDLHSEKDSVAIECKRLKGISWNQLVKFYKKLEKVSECDVNLIVFKSNLQPALVFQESLSGYVILEFKDAFNVPFLKHPSTRVSKNKSG